MEELLIIVVIILVIVCAVIFGLLQKKSGYFKTTAPAVKEGGDSTTIAKKLAVIKPIGSLKSTYGSLKHDNEATNKLNTDLKAFNTAKVDISNSIQQLLLSAVPEDAKITELSKLIEQYDNYVKLFGTINAEYVSLINNNKSHRTQPTKNLYDKQINLITVIDQFTKAFALFNEFTTLAKDADQMKDAITRGVNTTKSQFVVINNQINSMNASLMNDKALSATLNAEQAAITTAVNAILAIKFADAMVAMSVKPFDDASVKNACAVLDIVYAPLSSGKTVGEAAVELYSLPTLKKVIKDNADMSAQVDSFEKITTQLKQRFEFVEKRDKIIADDASIAGGIISGAIGDAVKAYTDLSTIAKTVVGEIQARIALYNTFVPQLESIEREVGKAINVVDVLNYVKNDISELQKLEAEVTKLDTDLVANAASYAPGAAPTTSLWYLPPKVIAACKSAGHLLILPVGTTPEAVINEYVKYFTDMPYIMHEIQTGAAVTLEICKMAASYIDAIMALTADANFIRFMTGVLHPGVSRADQIKYRVILNYITAINHPSVVVAFLKAIVPNVSSINDLVNRIPADTATITKRMNKAATFTRHAQRIYDDANALVYLADIPPKITDLETEITNFANKDYDTKIANFIPIYDLTAQKAAEAALGAAIDAAPPAEIPITDATLVPIASLNGAIMPVFDTNNALASVKTDFATQVAKVDNFINIDIVGWRADIAKRIQDQKDNADALRAKISAMARNIMSALKAEFVESAERIEAVKQDLEEQDRRDRARKRKEAEEAQKLADDEYNARLDALAQIPDETLADRVARIPAEYSNVIHYAMAKRATKLTGDTSYDVSAAEMGNTAIVRDKLVKFFTAQGIKDVTRDNINKKYAEWQKKHTTHLVYQSDIDNPQGVILEFA